MEKIKNFKIDKIPMSKIVFVVTDGDPYNMDRIILAENYPDYGDDYYVITGNHCSCYGFDSVQWEAITYNKEELIKLVDGWRDSWGAERVIAPLIKNHMGNLY